MLRVMKEATEAFQDAYMKVFAANPPIAREQLVAGALRYIVDESSLPEEILIDGLERSGLRHEKGLPFKVRTNKAIALFLCAIEQDLREEEKDSVMEARRIVSALDNDDISCWCEGERIDEDHLVTLIAAVLRTRSFPRQGPAEAFNGQD